MSRVPFGSKDKMASGFMSERVVDSGIGLATSGGSRKSNPGPNPNGFKFGPSNMGCHLDAGDPAWICALGPLSEPI